VLNSGDIPLSFGDSIIVVSGLPRSGTSLMMAMLQAGGVLLLTDGIRAPDADNPNGYFEFEPVKLLRTDHTWLTEARGKAVKIVLPLLFQLPKTFAIRVLFMERNLAEVIASQTAMLTRKGLQLQLPPETLKAAFERQLMQAQAFLVAGSESKSVRINFGEVLTNPADVAAAVASFLQAKLDVAAMAAIVNPALYRQRTPVPFRTR
jgi:hypothetical protein